RDAPRGPRQCAPAVGAVAADHRRRAAVRDVRGELTDAAAEVEDAAARDVREQRHEARMRERPGPARAEPLEPRVAREERGIVVDVLRRWLRGHAPSSYRSW